MRKRVTGISLMEFSYQVYKLFWQGLDQVFPPQCASCYKKGYRWCPDCQSKVRTIGSTLCPICGNLQQGASLCRKCKQNRPPYHQLRSWAVFKSPIREAIHQLKYRRNLGLGESLSMPLIQMISDLNWKMDLVVPVPLSSQRLKQRGYNQAALLAKPVALALSIPYSDSALMRFKETKSQVGLSIIERRLNVNGVFKASSRLVAGKRVIVVDDVTTTGATIEACALALIEAGACEVNGITLARAVLGEDITRA